jgi:hypothetical protein
MVGILVLQAQVLLFKEERQQWKSLDKQCTGLVLNLHLQYIPDLLFPELSST